MARFEIEVDRTTCQGFGACVELCPQSFRLSDSDGKTEIEGGKKIIEKGTAVRELLETDQLGCIREVAEACPFNAIHIIDTKTNEKLV
jgi:ferredoxin